MGVVRREGDWRLEKRRDGVYQITFRTEPQLNVYTPDASRLRNQPLFEAVPTYDVGSYSEVEGLFEEKAHGPPPLGMASPANGPTGRASTESDDLDLDDVPPIGISVAFLLVGGFTIYTFWGTTNTIALLFGLGFLALGLLPLGYAAYRFNADGWRAAAEFLVTVEANDDTAEDTTKTPPAPKKLKNAIIFDRADQHCEWCENPFDFLEVHHIVPRSEGGPNDPGNLVALCPNCHENADREAIPRSKIQAKVRRLPAVSVD
ncbi:HNH endonuclease [Halovivax gelatinilyticus]|uniref:HNH endonuclease n=1 Tax=Halovivax gelatinilyticus TaxID=2961597 RepID=UPI0020CA4527|nr:HNH endonuclease [Halovivax gelatinilyticus]